MEHEQAPDAGPAVDPAALGQVDGVQLTAGTEAAEGGGGMPQLNPDFFGNQIFWLLVALVVIFLMLSRVALPRIGGTLATRAGTISSDLAAAETLRAQAREAQAAYDRAVAEARAESNRIATETRARIQESLNAELAKADARIEAASAESARVLQGIQAEAATSVAEVARDAARAIVERLGGRAGEAEVDAAVGRVTRT